jgi:hypothetical protein
MESLDEEDYIAKDRIFYTAMVNAWLNTRLEHDKQLLSLSTTAIGLLVTLSKTVGVSNLFQAIIVWFALLSFLVTIISVTCVLKKNSAYIEEVMNRSLHHASESSAYLKRSDKLASQSFNLGVSLVVLIGICSTIISIKERHYE